MIAGMPVIAVDLGGTQIRACLVRAGQIRHRRAEPTASERGIEAVIGSILGVIRAVGAAAGRSDLPVGVASPGPLDPRTGVIFEAPNLQGWYDVPLGPRLAEALGTPVFIGNDANCAVLGEYQFGAGRGARDLCYVTVSTGIGGGVISDGRLIEGTAGAATEVGHMTLDLAGPRCNCGNIGCWEALASGPAIARAAQAAIDRGVTTSMPHVAARLGESGLTPAVVAEAARGGDPAAAAIMRHAGTITGHGLVNLAHLFDPDLIILGGGVMNAGPLILEPALEVFNRYAMPNYRRTCRIVTAALGDDVGLYGAAALVAQRSDA
jgi:glucokinase